MNPYYAYIASFSVAMALYTLGWSERFPQFSAALAVFLLATIGAYAAVGYMWQKKMIGALKQTPVLEAINPVHVTVFIYILWMADFIYEGGIPLIKILFDLPYNYRSFGVPSLHVFTVTFASFYTVCLFQLYLNTRRKILLLLYAINLFAAVLIFSRAMLFFNVAASFFLMIHAMKRLPLLHVLSGIAGILLLLYFFGVLGSLRESHVHHENGNASFLGTGGATEAFRNSMVPDEYFWTYIYITSPLANLQKNINRADKHPVGMPRLGEMIVSELIFDFISKRVFKAGWLTDPGEHTIFPFNVSTVYSRCYSYQGWFGMGVMAIFILVIPWIYARILGPASPYFETGMAILCTMYLFMMYDNTIRFTGLGFQLVYPVIFSWLGKKQFLSLLKAAS